MTLEEIESLAIEAFEIRKRKDACEDEIKRLSMGARALEATIEAALAGIGKSSWEGSSGTIEFRKKTSVRVPRDPESKKAFFGWLEDRGIFWDTVGVNANTLNALYKAEFDAKTEAGEDCSIPGIGDPEIYQTIHYRRKK